MGTIGQTPVDPAGLKNGIIGGRQVGPDQVRRQRPVCFGDVFELNNWIGT